MKQFEFNKTEKLSLKNSIDTLFNEGNSFSINYLRVIYFIDENETSFLVKTLFTVPKKKFKKAVDRNRIKRLLRETYRLNKHILYSGLNNSTNYLNIAFIYSGDKADITLKEIESIMISALKKLLLLLKSKN